MQKKAKLMPCHITANGNQIYVLLFEIASNCSFLKWKVHLAKNNLQYYYKAKHCLFYFSDVHYFH